MHRLDPLWLAISTYSICPAPRVAWQAESQPRMHVVLACLPLVGVLPALMLLLWQRLCWLLQAGTLLFGAGAALLPLLVTGGIHMDGFMDTLDALGSRQPRERKLAIMKDPHAGSFAVIGCTGYLLLSCSFYMALAADTRLWVVGLGFPLARALCAFCVFSMPSARPGGMLHALSRGVYDRRAAGIMLLTALICLAAMLPCGWMLVLIVAIAAAACCFGYRCMARRQFGGVTGDTSGFFIQSCELCLLAAFWLEGRL